MPYLLFLKQQQNFKLLSAANYRWPFMLELLCKIIIVKSGAILMCPLDGPRSAELFTGL